MTYMMWSDTYRVGVDLMDEEHQVLMDLVNQVYDGLHASAPEEEIRGTFQRLTAYTATHFWHEEKRFAETDYPRAAIHARKHQHLKVILSCFLKGLDSTGKQISFEDQIEFLRGWLVDHITGEDKKFGEYLNAQRRSKSISGLGA